MEQLVVTPDRLVIDEANMRKSHKQADIDSMKASILADGIIMPLAVRPPVESDIDLGGQLYRVTAGGRRMRAIQELLKEGAITNDFEVPIIVRDGDDSDATGKSIAENIIRTQPEPIDEFRAFKALHDKGSSAADIAIRFGQSERYVKQRLALADVHPKIIEAFERDAIKLEALMAYTVTPDQEAQFQFFENGETWAIDNAHQIRRALSGDAIPSTSPIAKFVGEDAYREAGGTVNEDLFGDRSYWADPDLARTLATTKVEQWKKAKAEEGWSFVALFEDLGVAYWDVRKQAPQGQEISKEDAARMEAIADKWDAYDDDIPEELYGEYEDEMQEYGRLQESGKFFSAEQKASLGAVFSLERYEEFLGVIHPKDAKKAVPGSHSSNDDSKPAKDPLALTTPLKEQIGDTATKALADAIIANPEKAPAFVAALLELKLAHVPMGSGIPCRIGVETVDYGGASFRNSENQRSYINAFRAYDKMKPAEFKKALADLVAKTVDLSEKWFQKDYTGDEKREQLRRECINVFAADPIPHIDYEAWFEKCTKPMIEEAWREMKGKVPSVALPAKKKDMVAVAAVEAKNRGWLPKELRGKGYKLKG